MFDSNQKNDFRFIVWPALALFLLCGIFAALGPGSVAAVFFFATFAWLAICACLTEFSPF